MADKNKPESTASRAGRWFARLLGKRNVRKLAESAEALRQEYTAGKREAEDPPPKRISHRVIDDDE